MARTARYTAPVSVVEEPWMRDAIKEIADAEEVSEACVLRSLHYHGIKWRQQLSADILAGKAERPRE